LKCPAGPDCLSAEELLIAPKGIEMHAGQMNIRSIFLLLIAPKGIEIPLSS